MTLRNIFILGTILLLGACSRSVEMPTSPEGIDEMRISPCVCNEINFKGPTFTWIG